MAESKKRSEQHIIDDKAQALLKSVLPPHWVLREYRPDYGIDYDLEMFKEIPANRGRVYATLGEHVFIQLKGHGELATTTLDVKERYNVEKAPMTKTDKVAGSVEVVSHSLEVSELITVQRMGSGLPVLLVLADTGAQQCYFVCVNDYIDKILIPGHEDYTSKETRTIHIPCVNNLKDPFIGPSALRWYAKRAKLYAAFQKFVYQEAELNYAFETEEFLPLAKHFAQILARYDFWSDTEMWAIIEYYGGAIRRFLETGEPGLLQVNEAALSGLGERSDAARAFLKRQEIHQLWKFLTVLPRNFEEVCREWYLPTPLGLTASYPPGTSLVSASSAAAPAEFPSEGTSPQVTPQAGGATGAIET